MFKLPNGLYYKLRKEEIDRATIKLKRMKIDTMLQNLSRICWKNNVKYHVIIKTGEVLTILLSGYSERVVFKFHKADLVSRKEMDLFLNEIDEYRAQRGFYVTTGGFEKIKDYKIRKLPLKKDTSFEDNIMFLKGQLGISKRLSENFTETKIDLFRYLPQ
jgi:hypothetical protein